MSDTNVQSGADRPVRKRRSDGERSRNAILREAAQLATIDGLNGLSISRLADAVGMSKSGLFAHFGSKQELQLATIEAASAIFSEQVLEPALLAPTGMQRLRLLADRYFTYGGSIYLDYALMGVPNMVGGAAWEFLRQLTVEHPYSEDFSESVTDWVWWFDAKQQDLSIERNGAAPSLIVRSPSGNRIAITLEQSPMGASA